MIHTGSRIASFLREDWSFSQSPPVTDFCEQNIVLPPAMAPASSGPFSVGRRPWQREILECGHPSSGVRSLTVTGGAQTGKTTPLILIVAYRIAHSPLPTLILGNSEDWLRIEISEKRLKALIENNHALRIHKPFDANKFRTLSMEMSGGFIVFEGINSDTSTSGSTQGIVYICEAAKVQHHEKEQTPEAHPIKLAFERTKEFRGLELQMMDFTPNTPNHIAWKTYLRGTQSHFHVPCPHCGHHFPFEFEVRRHGEKAADDELENVLEEEQTRAVSDDYRSLIWSPSAHRADGTWDLDIVRRTIRYICPKNGCEITDDHKMGMVEKYQVEHHNKNARLDDRSFRVPSFYAPKMSFGDMAKEFLEKGDLITTGLQNFYNSYLALPWSILAYNISQKHILALKGDYARGIVPHMPAFTMITSDPGEKATHWAFIAVMSNGDLYYIDWGSVTSERTLISDDFLRARRYYLAGTQSLVQPMRGFIDSGWNTEEVYNVCEASKGFFWPTKGDPKATGTWNETRAATRPGLRLYTYSDPQLKDEFYGRRIQRQKGPRVFIPENADLDLIHGLSDQQKDRQTNQWKRIPHDHLGDCGKLGLLGSQIARAAGVLKF